MRYLQDKIYHFLSHVFCFAFAIKKRDICGPTNWVLWNYCTIISTSTTVLILTAYWIAKKKHKSIASPNILITHTIIPVTIGSRHDHGGAVLDTLAHVHLQHSVPSNEQSTTADKKMALKEWTKQYWPICRHRVSYRVSNFYHAIISCWAATAKAKQHRVFPGSRF